MFIVQALRWLLLGIELLIALSILYLCLVSFSALLAARRRRRRPAIFAPPYARFALLIPAHNETAVIGKLLHSLTELNYPAEQFTVCVVADNCTDTTADLARASAGVRVYERHDEQRRGKGFALQWLLEQLQQDGLTFDAYVILDADSVVDAAFLQALNHGLQGGARALQAHNAVLNVADSPATALRWLALSLMNHVRPLGRNGLGGSSTLTGNGMCLSRAVLERYPWQAFALAEDYQYYLTLVQHGEKVIYMPEALVRSEMPVTFEQMRTQDIRWESLQGTPPTWKTAWRLLQAGLRRRSFLCLEALGEFLVPSLSYLIAGCFLALLAALLLWSWLDILVACLLIAGLLFYGSSAFVLLRPPRMLFLALLSAPRFVLWKIWVVLVLRRRKKHQAEWVRTSRNQAS